MDTLAQRRAPDAFGVPSGNRLIDALPPLERERLGESLRRTDLRPGQPLFEQGVETPDAIFPLSGVASLLAVATDGETVEVATVGNEGMVGLHLFLGVRANWVSRAVQQIPGEGLLMSADVLHEETAREGPFRHGLLRYTQALFAQITQGAACNRLHPLEQRCARWLLMCQDRAGSDEFALTHEFLSDMLGVRRPSVTIALGTLQEAGLISTRRAHIHVRDRHGLEAASCGCYAAIRDEYERALPGT